MIRSEDMKEKYIPAELDIIVFGRCDIITMSNNTTPPAGGDNASGGTGIGGGYNPGGWT